MRIERVVQAVPLADYADDLLEQVQADSRARRHIVDLMPPDADAPMAVIWRRAPADRALTETARLGPRGE